MNNQNEIPQILVQENQLANNNENINKEVRNIKKMIKDIHLTSTFLIAMFIFAFSMITSLFVPGAFMGKWQGDGSHIFTLVAIILPCVFIIIFLFFQIFYFLRAKKSTTWNYINSQIKKISTNGTNDVIASNKGMDNVNTGLRVGLGVNALGNLLDDDLISDLGTFSQGYAAINLIKLMKKRSEILERKFKLTTFEKFKVKLPIIIAVIYVIIMIIVGINVVNNDKEEIMSGRYDTLYSIVSIYSDMGAKVDSEYSFDSVNKTYDSQYATIVMANGDEISFSMINSSKITDNIEYIVSYDGVTIDDLNNIVNDFASRTIVLQSRANRFKEHVKDPRQVEVLMSFDDEQKQEIVNEIISSIQEKSSDLSYDIIQNISGHIYYQTSYISLDNQMDGTYTIKFRTMIRAKE